MVRHCVQLLCIFKGLCVDVLLFRELTSSIFVMCFQPVRTFPCIYRKFHYSIYEHDELVFFLSIKDSYPMSYQYWLHNLSHSCMYMCIFSTHCNISNIHCSRRSKIIKFLLSFRSGKIGFGETCCECEITWLHSSDIWWVTCSCSTNQFWEFPVLLRNNL
jgi:hypothetical protein